MGFFLIFGGILGVILGGKRNKKTLKIFFLHSKSWTSVQRQWMWRCFGRFQKGTTKITKTKQTGNTPTCFKHNNNLWKFYFDNLLWYRCVLTAVLLPLKNPKHGGHVVVAIKNTDLLKRGVPFVQRCFTRRLSDLHKLIRSTEGLEHVISFPNLKMLSLIQLLGMTNVKLASREANMFCSTILPVLFLPKKISAVCQRWQMWVICLHSL